MTQTETVSPEVVAPVKSRKKNIEMLAGAYTREKRIAEICFTVSFFLLYAKAIHNVASSIAWDWQAVVLGVVAFWTSMLFGDVYSGVLHWAWDTWGRVDWPFFGKAFIRPFREHHVDAMAITRHDFVECNGDVFLCVTPVLCLNAFADLGFDDRPRWFIGWFVLCVVTWVAFTNQLHKWAHETKPIWPVRVMQELTIFLPRRHHKEHHTSPYARTYNITNGWLNNTFDAIRLWRNIEEGITFLTGWIPRSDDQAWLLASFPHLKSGQWDLVK